MNDKTNTGEQMSKKFKTEYFNNKQSSMGDHAQIKFASILEPKGYNGGEPKYSIAVSISKDDPLVKEIQRVQQLAFEQAKEITKGDKKKGPDGKTAHERVFLFDKCLPEYKYDPETKTETDEETGRLVVKANTGLNYPPKIYIASKHDPSKYVLFTPPQGMKELPWGSKVVLSTTLSTYSTNSGQTGCSVRLENILIISLGGRDDSCPFGEVTVDDEMETYSTVADPDDF